MERLMNMKDRLIEYVRCFDRISFRDFERKVGLSDGFLSRPGQISIDSLLKIATVCPELSLRWLLLGEGSMNDCRNNVSIVHSGDNGRINNVNGSVYGGIDNSVVKIETVCEEVKALQVLVRDLRLEKEEEHRMNLELHKENQKLLDMLENALRK